MKIEVRYYTRSGNTEKLAGAVAAALDVKALSLNAPLTEKTDVLFLGCSYYAFDVDDAVKAFILSNKDKIGTIVCFGTSAMMKSVYKPMKKVADEAGVKMVEDDFHCHGSFGPFHKGKPDDRDVENAAAFAKNVLKTI